MRNHIRKVRKSDITRDEIKGDIIFLFISASISFMVVLLFDTHHSFYEWPMTLKFIFNTPYPYVIFTTLGALIGFFMLKLLIIGLKEEGV